MRRLGAMALTLCALAAGALAATLNGGAEAASDYRVDAIFDTSKGVIPGQLVKVAGARVGMVEDVTLTDDYKARIQMTVDSRFAPFKSDANCLIRPEGLVGENFVECNPGSAEAEPLEASNGEAATVPVEQTAVPVNLTDLFDIFNAPVRDRFSVVLSALGAGAAGRGEDLNELLRRANPALAEARRTIAILRQQRDRLNDTVEVSDRLLADLASRSGRVADFIDEAAAVTRRTAERDDELRETVRRLPPLLDQAEPALANFDRVMTDATPLLRDLRGAAPAIERLTIDLEPFSRAALPVIRETHAQGGRLRRLTREAGPVIAQLRDFAGRARPVAVVVRELFESLRDRGAVEGLLDFVYYATSNIARYDTTSHILPARIAGNECSFFASVEDVACSARYRTEERSGSGIVPGSAEPRPARERAATAAPGPERAAPPAAEPDTPADLIEQLTEQLEELTGPARDRLTQDLEALTGDSLDRLGGRGRAPSPQFVIPILDYLLR